MSGANLKSGSWVLLDNLFAAVVAFGFFVVSARVLSPFDFGVAARAISVAQIATPMIESLFHDAIIQREDLQPDDVQTAFTTALLWSIVIAALLILASPAIASLTGAPPLAQYLPWMALSVLASGLVAIPSALARRQMDFRALAIRTILARTIATIIGLVLIFRGVGIWGVVVQAIAAALLSAVFILIVMRPSFRLLIDRTRLGYLLRFASASMGTQLLLFASSRVFTLLMSGLLGPVAAATWAVALRFVEPLQVMAATTLGQFTLPIYSRKQADRAALEGLFLSGSRRASLVLVPMFVGLAACAGPIITLFVGEQWLAAAPLMAVICLVFAVVASRQLVEITLTSLGAPQLNLVVQAAAILLSLVGFAIGARAGLFDATLGWSLRALPFVTVAAWFLYSRAGISLGKQCVAVAPVFAASGVMAAAVIAAQRTLLVGHGTIVTLIGSIATGVVSYLIAALLLDRHTRSDLMQLHAWRRGAAMIEPPPID